MPTTSQQSPAASSGSVASAPNQPRRLIVTVYALYARETANWLSVLSTVRLLDQLGVDEPAVRSSISRLKRRGILESNKRDGVVGYSLSDSALEIIREGDRRIFRRERAAEDAGWLLAVFSVPEAMCDQRHVMRRILTELGFGTAAPGVWIGPAHLYDDTAKVLRTAGLDRYVDLFHAEHRAFGNASEKVAQWWDLDQLHDLYSEFISRYEPLRTRNKRRRTPPAQEAFAGYVDALTSWRRLPYLDPGLPLKLLPAGWKGARASDLFDWLQHTLEEPAHRHAKSIIDGTAR